MLTERAISRRTGAAWMLVCMAFVALAGALHSHHLEFESTTRLELQPEQRVAAVDPCVACLLVRILVEPGSGPVSAEMALPRAGIAGDLQASPASSCFRGTVGGRAPPQLLAAAA